MPLASSLYKWNGFVMSGRARTGVDSRAFFKALKALYSVSVHSKGCVPLVSPWAPSPSLFLFPPLLSVSPKEQPLPRVPCLSLAESQLLLAFWAVSKSWDKLIPSNPCDFWIFLLVSGTDYTTKATLVACWFGGGAFGPMGVNTQPVPQSFSRNLVDDSWSP